MKFYFCIGWVLMAIINALPENLQALFAPRSPLPYFPSTERKKLPPYTGIASYTDLFEDPNASSDSRNADDYLHVLTREQKIRRKENMRAFKHENNIKEQEEQCIYHQNNNHLFFFFFIFFHP